MFCDGRYCNWFWCHISPTHAAQVIVHYRAHLNVKSVEWQLRVPCVGCRGLYHWIITVTCWSWQSLSTPRDTWCHLLNFFFRKSSSEILAALTSAFSCVLGRLWLLFRQLHDEGFHQTRRCRKEHVPQQDPMLQMPVSFPLASSVIREAWRAVLQSNLLKLRCAWKDNSNLCKC